MASTSKGVKSVARKLFWELSKGVQAPPPPKKQAVNNMYLENVKQHETILKKYFVIVTG